MSAGNPRSPTGSPFARSLPQHTHHSCQSTAKHIASSARAVASSEHNAGGRFCEFGAAVAIRTGSWHRYCSRAAAPRSACRAQWRDVASCHRRDRDTVRRPTHRRATSVTVGMVWRRHRPTCYSANAHVAPSPLPCVCWGHRTRCHRAPPRANPDFANPDGVRVVLEIDSGVSLIFTGRTLTGVAEFMNETIATVVDRNFAVSFLPRIGRVRQKL